MTIHHDKLAYGRLASSREDLSEQKLLEMAKKLNGGKEADERDSAAETSDIPRRNAVPRSE